MNQPQDVTNESPLKVLKDQGDAWLKVLYVEAWKQYVHEDMLTQARTNIFQVIPVVLLAFLGAASAAIVKLGCFTYQGKTILLGVSLVGVIWVLVAVLMFSLIGAFTKVTDAGQLHVNLRHMNARAIERLARVGLFGPAMMEHHMRDFKPSSTDDRFRPFVDIPELKSYGDLSSRGYSGFGGFTYLRHITTVWKIVFGLVLAFGVAILVLGICSPSLELHKILPALAC